MLNKIFINPFMFIKVIFILIPALIIYNYFKQNINLNNYNITYEYHYIYIIIYVSMLVTLLLIIFINKKILLRNKNILFIFLIFALVLFFLIFSKSIFIFFISYEMLLLLTALIVNLTSPNIRSKIITLYFLFWTQLSSFFLWIAVFVIYKYTNSTTFIFNNNLIPLNIKLLIKWILFIGFSIKLPLWPFSFWLIKTHVEANTSFSIFLSGVLVKTALIGLLKFQYFFINTNNTLIIHIVIISLIATTYSLASQVDFKKLIAYTTVQEMSLIVFFIIYNNFINLNIILYFILIHTFFSIILFFLNDIIYIRFKTRKTKLLLGISTTMPKLSSLIILIWLIFTGLPLSFKFILEIIFLLKILTLPNIIIFIFIITIQFLSIIFITINIITYIFGNGNKTSFDLSKNEFIIIIITLLFITLLLF